MSLFFQVLASGSKGNALLIRSAKTRVLLDAGLSGKELVRRLEKTPVRGGDLSGLVISHEHQDHVRGAGISSRRLDLPIYLSRGTLQNLPHRFGPLPHVQVFQPGASFSIGDITIQPFATSHDAGEPAGFVVENDGARLGVCTDLGVATQLVRARLQDCQGLVIESNHDIGLLLNGPYPPELKQRIRSRHGHLSNADTLELLGSLHHTGLKKVVLAHLSETNNHPRLVLDGLEVLIQDSRWREVSFEVGSQHEVSAGFELP